MFILIHFGFLIWYINAYKAIINIKKEETKFIKSVNNQITYKNISF
jgi:hypothetical protein